MENISMDKIFGTFTSWKYDEHTWFITSLNGSLYMYLLEGEKAALLIDTAYGCGNLRELVEQLTQKPIIVVNTHGHLDHAGGNGQWEQVYMHENAVIDHATLEGGPCDISKLPFPDYQKVFINEGYVFDLGDREVKVIDISAHSNGSLAFIDESRRLLFTGDEIESAQVLMYELVEMKENPYNFKKRVSHHKDNMEKLKKIAEKFDFICPGHNGAPISKEYIQNYINLDKKILSGEIIPVELNHEYLEQTPLAPYLKRLRENNASFIFREKDIIQEVL